MGTGSSMSGCTNYGNLTSTTGARCGGITSLSNTATFENCANYGTILSDGNRGVFWAYNNGAAQWTNCTAGGKVGTYNNGTPVFDSYAEADQANYLGKQGSNKSTLTNIVYQIGARAEAVRAAMQNCASSSSATVSRKTPWSICPAY